MRAKRIILFASAWIFVLAAAPAWAQFVPGHVFVSDPASDFCFHGGELYWDRIWEIDPETGEVTLFAEFFADDCRFFITGLVFTPDGCRLRASAMLTDEILEFDSDGTWTVALDATDGISAPWGSNNLAYDAEGNFYVVNAGSRTIMRFPAVSGPGVILADNADGILGDGPIAIATNGDVYFGNTQLERYVLRVTPQGDPSIFDRYAIINVPYSVTADDAGSVYVALGGEGGGIYRYDASDPKSKQLLASSPVFSKFYAMTMMSNQKGIYTVASTTKQLLTVDVGDGSIKTLAEIADGTVPVGGIGVVPVLMGDLNRNRSVNIADYGLFSVCISGPGSGAGGNPTLECQRADLDSDGDIDIGDFALLQLGFGTALAACP